MHWLALGCSLWFIGEVVHICFKLSNYSSSAWGGNTVACTLIVWRNSTRGGLVYSCRSAGVRYLADGVIPPRISVLSPARESSSWFVLALLSLVWCSSCSSAVSCQLFSLASSMVRGGECFSDQYAVLTDGLYPFRRMEKLRWWEDLRVCGGRGRGLGWECRSWETPYECVYMGGRGQWQRPPGSKGAK